MGRSSGLSSGAECAILAKCVFVWRDPCRCAHSRHGVEEAHLQVSSSKRVWEERALESSSRQMGRGKGAGSCANHLKLFADKSRTWKCLGCLVWAPRILHRPVLIHNHLIPFCLLLFFQFKSFQPAGSGFAAVLPCSYFSAFGRGKSHFCSKLCN